MYGKGEYTLYMSYTLCTLYILYTFYTLCALYTLYTSYILAKFIIELYNFKIIIITYLIQKCKVLPINKTLSMLCFLNSFPHYLATLLTWVIYSKRITLNSFTHRSIIPYDLCIMNYHNIFNDTFIFKSFEFFKL